MPADSPGFSSRIVSQEEAAIIAFQISLAVSNPLEAKAGLQRLCDVYEGNRRLPVVGAVTGETVRQQLPGLFYSKDTLVRRWSYKAAAWVGTKATFEPLSDRIGSEPDHENLTWAMAALLILSKVAELDGVKLPKNVELTPSMRLAARLFIPPKKLLGWEPVESVSLWTDDYLLLKWATLLEGYGQAPENLFGANVNTSSSLGDLTQHDDPEVAEYSVWARWKNGRYGITDLALPMDRVLGVPENVRRWIYRLITKRNGDAVAHADFIREVTNSDDGSRALEGLALGIKGINGIELEGVVVDWYAESTSDSIKQPLLEHMARNSPLSRTYSDAVIEEFKKGQNRGKLREKLIVASAGTELWNILQSISAGEDFSRAAVNLDLFMPERKAIIMAENYVKVDGNQNVITGVGGVVSGTTINAVSSSTVLSQSEKSYLDEVLTYLKEADLRNSERKPIEAAIESVSAQPTVENKSRLLTTLNSVVQSAGSALAIAEGAQSLIEKGRALFGV